MSAAVLGVAGALAVLGAAAPATACEPDTDARGWMAAAPSSAPVRPPDCARVEQSPPDFTWPAYARDASYELELVYPDGTRRTRRTQRNWSAWPDVLPAGEYTWRVTAIEADGTRHAGRVRGFVVAAGAEAFVLPDSEDVLAHARDVSRPRTLTRDVAATRALPNGPRRAGLEHLLGSVEDRLEAALPRAEQADYAAVDAACRQALDAALAWVATRERRYLEEARRRAAHLASWDPRGPTAHARMDQASRRIAWTLTLVYDWLADELSATERQRVLASVETRGGDIHADVLGRPGGFGFEPHDSHGHRSLVVLAAMSVVLAGDVAAADRWVRDAVPAAVHWTSPWGGEDGGFANGTAYALWDTGGELLAWYALRHAGGVDVGAKAWTRNLSRFLAYFMPPGAPGGVFGDGAERELSELRASVANAHARFAPSRLGRWYAAQLGGQDPARPELLLAPRGITDAEPALPADTPDARAFESIGWAAMHSDIADPDRVSVYFKSSPYGSYNHGHADQNSFVIDAHGERLAIDSGYYDAYGTPHWRSWYKRTLAHNAITFDGGRGQSVYERDGEIGAGELTRFEHETGYDIVSGDATAAYGGALMRAERTLVYLRPDTILVHDVLASEQPRRWEWNLHAHEKIEPADENAVRIRRRGVELCVEVLAGPRMRFTQTDAVTAAARQSRGAQWHGAFVSDGRTRRAEIVMRLEVDCGAQPSEVEQTECGPAVVLADHRVAFCAGGATVEPHASAGSRAAR